MKKNLFSLLVLITMLLAMASSAAASPSTITADQRQTTQQTPRQLVVKVYFTTREELNYLASRYDITQVDQSGDMAYIIGTDRDVAALRLAGFQVEVDEDKTKLINQSHLPLPGQGQDSIPGFPCYRTVEETYTSIQVIAANHPDMAELFDIGDSWDKLMPGGGAGYDILALRLTNENFGVIDEKPTFFLMAEIHAREYTTAEAATRYAEFLVDNYGVDPDVTWLLDYFRIYIVPMINPDGRKIAETGISWRKNVDNDDGCNDPNNWGTDLNRNHSFKWNEGGSSPNPCDGVYMGPSAGSEPEVQAIESFVLTLFLDQRGPGDNDPAPVDTTGIFITLHSYSELVLWSWGWTPNQAPNNIQLQTLGRHLGFFNAYTPLQSYYLYETSGTSEDFAYGELGIAGYTIEMGTDFFEGCTSFESTVYPDNRDALMYAFKAARRPYMNPSGPDSTNIAVKPVSANQGELVLLTATANDTNYFAEEPTQMIAGARYTIDSPSWITGTVTYPMTASDGSFDSKIEFIQATIDTNDLSFGRHTIYVDSMDENNNWGVTSSTFLYIIEPGVTPVIEGFVLTADTNQPISARVEAGVFTTTSDPATGYYSMTVYSGTYDLVVKADNFAPAIANGVVAQDYQVIQQDFHLSPVCTLFYDEVEDGNLGWSPEYPWAITGEASHSPTHSWTDSPGGDYGGSKNVSLTSPYFDFTDATGVTLKFWHEYITELGWDYGTVEYSTGGGWTKVTDYDGNSHGWTLAELPIPALDGQANARIRFRFSSDDNTNFDGWHVDDISIFAGGPNCGLPTAPTAEFTSSSPVPLGTPMEFTNQTQGSEPIDYLWDFGDGIGSSTNTNPSYTYTATGTYTVTLTATNNLGSSAISHPVAVEPAPINGLDITQLTPGLVYPGETIDLSADLLPETAAKPYFFSIDFGDGDTATGSSDQDPLLFSHAYATEGDFVLQVSVENEVMPEPISTTLDVSIAPTPTAPQADFTTDSPVKLGNPMQFTNLTSGTQPITYLWDFGDGKGKSTKTNPSYIYTTAGTYTVTLIATNLVDSDMVTKTVIIQPLYFTTFLPLASK